MKKLLVFQHVPYEPLGTLNPLIKAAGFRVRYINFGRKPDQVPSLEGHHGLIVLGGPMGANDEHCFPHLKIEQQLILQAIHAGLPVLGICLGAQLMAKALGATVFVGLQKEIGWHLVSPTEEAARDPLMKHLRAPTPIFQWHGDQFEIPDGATGLAYSDLCQHQAFRYGGNAYAFQFHLEADQALIERWLTVPAHRQELSQIGKQIDPQMIREHTIQLIKGQYDLAHKVFRSLSICLGWYVRPIHICHRVDSIVPVFSALNAFLV